MGSHYLPKPDLDFQTWQRNFIEYAAAHAAELGLAAGEADLLLDAQTSWQDALTAHETATNALRAATAAKLLARATLTGIVQPLVRRLQASPAMTNETRGRLGITIPDANRTNYSLPPEPPVARVDTSERLRHSLHIQNGGDSHRRAKPKGTIGCEVWVRIGPEPPSDGSQCAFVGLATRPVYVVELSGIDRGQTAHYMLRWAGTRGQPGPWSETVSATIA